MAETSRELGERYPGKSDSRIVSDRQESSTIISSSRVWGSTKLIRVYTGIKLELIQMDCFMLHIAF